MRKPLTKRPGEQYPLAEMDPKAFERSPCTRGFFLDAKFVDDGSERLQGQLWLRPESNRWTATLKDPTSCTQIFLAANTLSDLWKVVEAVLADPESPWVEDTWAQQRKVGGRKK